MKKTEQRVLTLTIIIFVLAISLFNTGIAFADDVVPPVEPVSSEEPASESVSEILEQLPENTELIVLNENGEIAPLVTEAAAEIILTSDPIWCPDGQIPGDAGCTAGYATATQLIAALNGVIGDGTIYFMSTYSTNDLTFDQTNSNLSGLGDLTIQGGWNGLTGLSYSLSGNTTLDSVGITISNWSGNVNINNLTVVGAHGDGISIFNAGDVDIEDTTVQDGLDGGAGISINNGYGYASGFDITLSNVTLGNNADNGLYALYVGSVTLNNITITENGNTGAYLMNTSGDGDFNLTGTNVLSNNNGDGLFVASDGFMEMENITANNNGGSGVSLDNTNGSGITLTGSNVFEGNDGQGFGASSTGDVSLNDISASNNGNSGMEVGGASVSLTGDHYYNENGWIGLIIHGGDVLINNVVADSNASYGAFITGGDLAATGMNIFTNNAGTGLYVTSTGDIDLSNVASADNMGNGLEIYNTVGNGNVVISSSVFSDNSNTGGIITSLGDVVLSGVIANGNDGGGFGVYNNYGGGDVTIDNSEFSNNMYSGVDTIQTSGNVIITNTAMNGNQSSGVSLVSVGDNIFIANSQFNSNGDYGIDANYSTGTLILSSVSFDCLNGLGDYYYNDTIFSACPPVKKDSASTDFALHVVFVNNDENTELDCVQYTGTMLMLNNGSHATFKCPITGSVSLYLMEEADLPTALPQGVDNVSGLNAVSNPSGSDTALDGEVMISFAIPQGVDAASLSILYWNGAEWIDLKDATFDDGREVIIGGFNTADGYFQANVNFSGIFVLVAK